MPPGRALLIEQLDAHGSAPADAALRVLALRGAGIEAEPHVIAGAAADDHLAENGTLRPDEQFRRDDRHRRALAKRIRDESPDVVFWASASFDDEPARLAGLGAPIVWWPSGVVPHDDSTRRIADDDAPWTWTPVDGPRLSKPRLSLWDGPYVLAPMPLVGEAGVRALESFAEVAHDAEAFDLVVLAHAQPELEAIARGLDVGSRVHFAGPAPREAETAWLQSARAAIFAGDAPLSGGLPLRALACGTPLIVLGETLEPLARWLRRHDVLGGAGVPGEALGESLERSTGTRALIGRGRALAGAASPAAIGARLASRRAAFGREDRSAA